MSAAAAPIHPAIPVGKIKTFGPVGEPYEVLGYSKNTIDGFPALQIRLVKTGEITEYSYLHMMDDPEAA